MNEHEFNPETVERWLDENAVEHHIALEIVAASDYDQLLQLWRNQSKELKECYAALGMV